MTTTVVGLFKDFSTAEKVVRDLNNSGLRREDLSILAKDRGEFGDFKGHEVKGDQDVSEGAIAGAGTGAAVGGIAGLLVGLGVLAIPGIGPVLAAGPIATTLAGAGVGAAAGGMIGALVDAGVPEHEAREYSRGVESGGTLVTAYSPDHMADEVASIMKRYGPIDINRMGWHESHFGTSASYSDTSYESGTRATTSTSTYGRLGSAGGTGHDRESTYTGSETYDYRGFNDFDPDFKTHYESTFSRGGRGYGYYQPAYRYGYDLGTNERFRNRTWYDFEMEARRDWEAEHHDSKWEDVKDAVRHGWEKVTGKR